MKIGVFSDSLAKLSRPAMFAWCAERGITDVELGVGAWGPWPRPHLDLATIGGLYALGRRLRPGPAGRNVGVILAFAWAAYPFTDYALQSNSNDTLVAALLVWALVAFASPIRRALLVALETATVPPSVTHSLLYDIAGPATPAAKLPADCGWPRISVPVPFL